MIKVDYKKIINLYLSVFFLVMLAYCSLNDIFPIGEWDDYSFPVASILNDHNFSINDSDLNIYKALYPEFSVYIDNNMWNLSGYMTKDGKGQMPWYFPVYAIACIPFTLILKLLKLSAIYAFPYTNLLFLMLSLIITAKYIQCNDTLKTILIIILSINPIVFYLSWPSAEVFIYSMMLIGLVFWYNRCYKRAAIFISIAGMMNPTIMSIGIIMIAEYFVVIIKKEEKNFKIKAFVKSNFWDIFRYGCCYILGIIPMIYNYYNIGHINLTASYNFFTQGNEKVIFRFLSYLFDLNYGILPYFGIILLLSLIMLPLAFIRKHFRYIQWIIVFLINVFLYSIMIHINSEMSGISRYNSWGVLPLIFAVILFGSKIIKIKRNVSAYKAALILSAIITSAIVFLYNPHIAENTSYVYFTPAARVVLDIAPQLYNPLYSTFNNRVNHIDGGYDYITPVIYCAEDGYVRKILASSDNTDQLLSEYFSYAGYQDWFTNKVNTLNENASYITVPAKYKIAKISDYILGTPIIFAAEGYNAGDYAVNGLSVPEPGFSWTDGNKFIMRFKTESDCRILHADIICGVYNGRQKVTIYADNIEVYTNNEYTGGSISFDFPNQDPNSFIELVFVMPDAVNLKELGYYNDSRTLGLALNQITISEGEENYGDSQK